MLIGIDKERESKIEKWTETNIIRETETDETQRQRHKAEKGNKREGESHRRAKKERKRQIQIREILDSTGQGSNILTGCQTTQIRSGCFYKGLFGPDVF